MKQSYYKNSNPTKDFMNPEKNLGRKHKSKSEAIAKKMKFGHENYDETKDYKKYRSEERRGIIHKQKD